MGGSQSASAANAASEAPGDFRHLNLVGESDAFREVLRLVRRLSQCDATVLVHGETGTGKELVARAIHYLGERRKSPFIAVNCGAIPDSLVESELFGHASGAFTDAKQARDGVVAQAHRGTLFLDEVDSLSPRSQVALLRFLHTVTQGRCTQHASTVGNCVAVATVSTRMENLFAGHLDFR